MATGVFDGLKKVVWNGLLVALALGVAAFSRALALRPDPAVCRHGSLVPVPR